MKEDIKEKINIDKLRENNYAFLFKKNNNSDMDKTVLRRSVINKGNSNSKEIYYNNSFSDEPDSKVDVDPRIEIAFKHLDLMNIINKFANKNILFIDLLFLSKNDLNELGLTLVQRNRLLKFTEAYQKFGKDYTSEEVILFFRKNNNFNINTKIKTKHKGKSDVIVNKAFLSEVFSPKGIKKTIEKPKKENIIEHNMQLNFTNTIIRKNSLIKNNSSRNLFSKYQKISKEVDKYMNDISINNDNNKNGHNVKCISNTALNPKRTLNRNRSMADLTEKNKVIYHSQRNFNELSCMKKFTDLQRQKELLKSSLSKCNNAIIEKRKLIKLLEEEL